MSNSPGEIIQPLNPADYFTLAMDDQIRLENMPGSLCCFGISLEKQPNIGELTARIDEFVERFPTSTASLQQRGRQFFWCRRTHANPVFFHQTSPSNEDETVFFHNAVLTLINQTEPRELVAPIQFYLLSGTGQHIFLVRWLHPFCDARGIDLIFKYLNTGAKEQRATFDQPKITSLTNLQLSKFKVWKSIRLFFQANKYIDRLDRFQSVQHGKLHNPPERLNYLNFKFTPEQTVRVAHQSRHYCGLTGTSLYYIGCFMRALWRLENHAPGDAYLVPYAFNLRRQKALTPLLGNHLGALFAQAPKTLLENREQLFHHLKQQNAQVIREQLDYAFLPVMWVARWLSLKKHGEELRKSYHFGTERSSFWFSDIGQPEFTEHHFLDAEVSGMFHLCQTSNPPGLGLLMCKYRQQLTLSYCFTEPLFDENWLRQVHELMTEELLGY